MGNASLLSAIFCNTLLSIFYVITVSLITSIIIILILLLSIPSTAAWQWQAFRKRKDDWNRFPKPQLGTVWKVWNNTPQASRTNCTNIPLSINKPLSKMMPPPHSSPAYFTDNLLSYRWFQGLVFSQLPPSAFRPRGLCCYPLTNSPSGEWVSPPKTH